MKPIEFITFLFEMRVHIHHLHHITESYAEHKALGSFYEAWDDILDKFIETYQGKYGRVFGSGLVKFDSSDAKSCIEYAKEELNKAPIDIADKDLQNIIADMIGLCNHTLYLLSLK